MKIEGTLEVAVVPDELWDMLHDPEFLKEVMPGCKELKMTAADTFEGQIGAKVGAIASQYDTKFTIRDKVRPASYRLEVEGNGKGGFVNGSTQINLALQGSGTLITYSGDVNIGGTIARIGQRLVEAAAKMLLNQGFKSLKKKIEEQTS